MGQCLAVLAVYRLRQGCLYHFRFKCFSNVDVWEALLNLSKALRQKILFSIIDYFKIPSRASVLKIIANEKPGQFLAGFLLCPSVTCLAFPCTGRKQLFPCQQVFPPPTKLGHHQLDKGTVWLEFLTVSYKRSVSCLTSVVKATAGVDCLGDVG